MRIGFDVSQTGTNKAGCGYFADGLINHLAEIDNKNQYILYPTFGTSYWDSQWHEKGVKIDRPNFRLGLGHSTFEEMRNFWVHLREADAKSLGDPDIIHANNFFFPERLRKARTIYTLYDLGFLVYPECTTEENRLVCFSGVYKASLYADYIVAISEFSRKHFLEVFPYFPPDRISVVYGGSRFHSGEDIRPQSNVSHLAPGRFWLNVGTLEPRKNHLTLLKAYALFKKQNAGSFPLVLAGMKGWLVDDFAGAVENLGLTDDILMPGYVDEPTLQWLYQNCFAFVFPSLFEGFGLPVLEAMSLGAPVIVSSASSLPEVVGNNGLLVDPRSEEEICRAMGKLATDPTFYSEQKSLARKRASRFSWQKAARQLLKIYEVILRDMPPRNH